MSRDIDTGNVKWRSLGIVNRLADEGGLVDLRDYSKPRRDFEGCKEQIAKRHISKKALANWYRTIDRICPALVREPKLLIPDIKGSAHIVHEGGQR